MNFKKLTLYSSVFAIQGLSNAVIPILPELAGVGSGDSTVSNLLFSGYFMGAFLSLVPLGILADRIGNLKVISIWSTADCLFGRSYYSSDSLWNLGISKFLEGCKLWSFFSCSFLHACRMGRQSAQPGGI